jgi:hypothetical protein
MDVTSQTIPAWLVASIMVYTGFIWLISRKEVIHMDTRIIAYTLLLWGVLYGVFQIFGVEIEIRGFLSRLMILILCLSQSAPLTISYIRSLMRRHGKQ